ncbi:hypothetical protein HBI67_026920 [Parastagonospora nodorum]|nr:hypothetical protein HBI66_070640 [Parastagonospora nodorum]KAH6083707.1 hypothetical protein HBI67_026920 [Parastagonospora nodorum]
MRVKTTKVHRVHAEARPLLRQEALMPPLDAWYAHRRTLPTVLLYDSTPEPLSDFTTHLIESLSRTLNYFLQYAGDIDFCTIGVGEGRPLRRTRIFWGGPEEQGATFIEASTKARIQSLLPRTTSEQTSFIWDRSAASARPLFVNEHPLAPLRGRSAGVRAQMTSFSCGGFSLALDMDHGLGDGSNLGLFLQYWAAVYNSMFHRDVRQSLESLPDVLFEPQTLENRVASIQFDEQKLQLARQLPTVAPFLPDLKSDTDLNPATAQPQPDIPQPVPTFDGVSGLLRLSAQDCEDIIRNIQVRATSPVVDLMALISFVWAAINRARQSTGTPAAALYMPMSLRSMLRLPPGLLGSPLMSMGVELPGEEFTSTAYFDAATLAVQTTKTVAQYTEENFLILTKEVIQCNSPSKFSRGRPSSHGRIGVSSVVRFGLNEVSFGSLKPIFICPLVPVPYMFIVKEAISAQGRASDASNRSASGSMKWYENGADIFFTLPHDVYEAFISVPAIARFATLYDE